MRVFRFVIGVTVAKGFQASRAQRAKCEGSYCLICARQPVDPMHVTPRSIGGCDEPECVVPACRGHHRAYDEGQLDLSVYLEPGFREEQAHAVKHLGLARAYRRITNSRSEAA